LLKDLTHTIFKILYGCKEKKDHKKENR